MLKEIKEGDFIKFYFDEKLIKAEVHKVEDEWVILFSKDFGGSWFLGFRKDWLKQHAKPTEVDLDKILPW